MGRERDESVLDMSLFSLLFSYRTTRNHVVINSRENERKTHYCYYYYYYYYYYS